METIEAQPHLKLDMIKGAVAYLKHVERHGMDLSTPDSMARAKSQLQLAISLEDEGLMILDRPWVNSLLKGIERALHDCSIDPIEATRRKQKGQVYEMT